jgi:hypothetical protein
MNVGPVARREHALKFRVHIEVGNHSGVLLSEEAGEVRDELSIGTQERRLGFGEGALGDQGIGCNS